MKKDLSGFIDSGATLKSGSGKWSEIKESLSESTDDLIIITSRSCKKFISKIPSKFTLVINEEPSLNLIDNYFDQIYKIIIVK